MTAPLLPPSCPSSTDPSRSPSPTPAQSSPRQHSTLLLLSEQFVISAGCVLFHLPTSRIVLVKSTSPTQKDTWLLPKGRKNVGEAIEATAVREAEEETGCECELMEVGMGTRATDGEVRGRVGDVVRQVRGREPVAVQMRKTRHGHEKIIFWYIAQVKKGTTQRALEPHEHYEVAFFKYDDAIARLSWDHDREIVRRAVALVRADTALNGKPH